MESMNLISIKDLTPEQTSSILDLSRSLKANPQNDTCSGKTLGMIFEKPSMRTRVSFEVGLTQMGGHAIYLSHDIGKIGKRESPKDVAHVLSRYLDVLMMRTFSHELVQSIAAHSTIPVINGLTDYLHPCQAMSDVFTIQEHFPDEKEIKLVFVGDGNNVSRSLAYAAEKVGIQFTLCAPEGYEFDEEFLSTMDSPVQIIHNPAEAVDNADVIYTDVWTSMGQDGAEKRKDIFRPYQINTELVQRAKNRVKVMHCLPAHRGEEITDNVIDSDASVVYDQAENRLHVQKAIITFLLGNQ